MRAGWVVASLASQPKPLSRKNQGQPLARSDTMRSVSAGQPSATAAGSGLRLPRGLMHRWMHRVPLTAAVCKWRGYAIRILVVSALRFR